MSIDVTLEFPDVMTDIETTGTKQAHNAIIQIAAVRFNLEKRTICHDFFDRCLLIPAHRSWDEDCRNNFWPKHPEVLQSIWARMEDPKTVLEAFYKWSGHGSRFWGKPTHFDYAFLQAYFTQYDMVMPYHYRMANDMNTFIRARYWPAEPPAFEREIEFQGSAHNALNDCLHQITVLFAAAEATKNQLLVP